MFWKKKNFRKLLRAWIVWSIFKFQFYPFYYIIRGDEEKKKNSMLKHATSYFIFQNTALYIPKHWNEMFVLFRRWIRYLDKNKYEEGNHWKKERKWNSYKLNKASIPSYFLNKHLFELKILWKSIYPQKSLLCKHAMCKQVQWHDGTSEEKVADVCAAQ